MPLYEGMLAETPIVIEQLTLEHIAELEALQQQVYETLPDKNTLQPLSTDEFTNILSGNGLLIGVYAREQLIAFRALLDPQDDPEHLGIDCGVAPENLSRVFYQEISNVSPDWRGYGLQKLMAHVIMAAADVARYDYVCATVKPYNIPSLKDKFSQGLIVKGLKLKYGGKLRYIFFKDLKSKAPVYHESEQVSMSNTAAQQALLQQGYVGTQLIKNGDDFAIVYEK